MSSRTTTKLSEIRKRAEERGGKPSRVRGTEEDGEPGVYYTSISRVTAARVRWKRSHGTIDWFRTSQDRDLGFLYQE